MNHYPHHIGDFDKATRHLTRIERSIYRDLIERYYDTEEQLTLDVRALSRFVLAHSNEELAAVEQVLNEFFIKTPIGWFHSRCDAEIEQYSANTTQKALAGKASAAAKALKIQQALNEKPTSVEQPLNGTATNQEPRTNNQEPCNSKDLSPPAASTPKRATRLPADWQLPKPWGEWALAEKPLLNADDIRRMAEMFKDHWIANASRATGKKDDWQATWRNWVRKNDGNGGAQSVRQTPTPENFANKNYGSEITAL